MNNNNEVRGLPVVFHFHVRKWQRYLEKGSFLAKRLLMATPTINKKPIPPCFSLSLFSPCILSGTRIYCQRISVFYQLSTHFPKSAVISRDVPTDMMTVCTQSILSCAETSREGRFYGNVFPCKLILSPGRGARADLEGSHHP